jgi:hypothetical protein
VLGFINLDPNSCIEKCLSAFRLCMLKINLKFIKPISMSNYVTNDLFNNNMQFGVIKSRPSNNISNFVDLCRYIHRYTHQSSMKMPSILHVHELQIYCSKNEQEICEKWKTRWSEGNQTQKNIVLYFIIWIFSLLCSRLLCLRYFFFSSYWCFLFF